MQPIRLGVIGAGLIWTRTHQPILNRLGDSFQLIAFCETSPERREQLAAEYPQAHIVADYRELLALPMVDAAVVLTPIPLLAPIAQAAIEAGKDVIMEKPIARSLAEGQALIDAAKRANRRLFVTEQLAYRKGETALAELLAAGEIGTVMTWERVQHWEAEKEPSPQSFASTPWRKQPDYPLGALFDGGVHLIASLSQVFGAPSSVAAHGRRLREEYGDYDQVSMLFAYPDGSSGMLSHSDCLPPLHNHFTIYGTEGTIAVRYRQIIVTPQHGREKQIDLSSEEPHVTMWNTLAQAFRNPATPFYTPEAALRDVAILLGVEQALKQKQQITLDLA